MAFIGIKISYWVEGDWVEGYASGFPENRLATDEIADETTVGGILQDNPEKYRWELNLAHELSGGLDLKADYDIGPETRVRLEFRTFPEGSLQELNTIKFGGRTESYTYDDIGNTLIWEGRPIRLTPSSSNPDVVADTYRLGVYISYLGNSDAHPGGAVDWGGTVFQTNVDINDINIAMNPSSQYLQGYGICVNATEDTEAEFSVYTTHLTKSSFIGNVPEVRLGAFLNGIVPNEGLAFDMSAAEDSVSLTQKEEDNPGDHSVYRLDLSVDYATGGQQDLQVGAFQSFIYGGWDNGDGSLFKEGLGRYWIDPQQYGNWFYHEALQWAYDPGQPNLDDLFLYLLGGGWLISKLELWPWVYLDNLSSWAYLDYERRLFWVPGEGDNVWRQWGNFDGSGWEFLE